MEIEINGIEYFDYNLVVCQANGRPIEANLIQKKFKKLIKENNLPPVVFYSLRHSSITYKLKWNSRKAIFVSRNTKNLLIFISRPLLTKVTGYLLKAI